MDELSAKAQEFKKFQEEQSAKQEAHCAREHSLGYSKSLKESMIDCGKEFACFLARMYDAYSTLKDVREMLDGYVRDELEYIKTKLEDLKKETNVWFAGDPFLIPIESLKDKYIGVHNLLRTLVGKLEETKMFARVKQLGHVHSAAHNVGYLIGDVSDSIDQYNSLSGYWKLAAFVVPLVRTAMVAGDAACAYKWDDKINDIRHAIKKCKEGEYSLNSAVETFKQKQDDVMKSFKG